MNFRTYLTWWWMGATLAGCLALYAAYPNDHSLLPTLRAALPPDPGAAAEPDPATDWLVWLSWYRHRWLDQRPTTLAPDQSAHYYLLRLQAEALETEAAALTALLSPTAPPA
jgi:hypothetical protein